LLSLRNGAGRGGAALRLLEYLKTILLRVSLSQTLFEKELKKGLRALGEEDPLQPEQWCCFKSAVVAVPGVEKLPAEKPLLRVFHVSVCFLQK
jgi:hypothetical protein